MISSTDYPKKPPIFSQVRYPNTFQKEYIPAFQITQIIQKCIGSIKNKTKITEKDTRF